MDRARHARDVAVIATIAFLATYVLPLFVELPQIWYLPLERRWTFGARPPGLPMDWFGRTLYALIAGAVAVIAAAAVMRKVKLGDRAAAMALAVAFALALGAYALEHAG